MEPTESRTLADRGAYGLRLPGLPGQRWLVPAPTSWTPWKVAIDPSPLVKRPAQKWDSNESCLNSAPRGYVHIDRASSRTTVCHGRVPVTNAFAHPILVSTALVVAGWQQRLAFHGGAVLDRGGRAWGILSDREGGRTMFLGWCAAHGLDVLASDLVVTDGLEVFAGPRLLDLDENESRHYALGDDIGVVGNRRRWRVALPEVPTTAPLGGWLTLVHGPDRELRPLAVPERARLLKRSRRVDIARHHQQPWLQALTVPAFAATSRRGNPPEDTAMRSLFETLDATTESSMS